MDTMKDDCYEVLTTHASLEEALAALKKNPVGVIVADRNGVEVKLDSSGNLFYASTPIY